MTGHPLTPSTPPARSGGPEAAPDLAAIAALAGTGTEQRLQGGQTSAAALITTAASCPLRRPPRRPQGPQA
jgi:hypothetical protein